MKSFFGTWPALITPFTSDDQVNTGMLSDLVEHFISSQVNGFYVCGNTGLGLSMSVDERKLVAQVVIEQVAGRVPVIVHVGSPAVGDAITLARHARDNGADGVSSIIPPEFHDEEAILTYYCRIAQAVPEITLWPYIFKSSENVVQFVRNLTEIPIVNGVKYTGPNMFELKRIIDIREKNWYVFSGMDEQCAFAAMFGTHGNIGSTVNIMPGIYKEIHSTVSDGNFQKAVQLQEKANSVIRLMYKVDFRGALYEMMAAQGFNCGEPRLPGKPLSASEKSELRANLDGLDIL